MLWFNSNRVPAGRWPFLNAARVGLCDLEEGLIERLDLTEGTGTVVITGCMQAYRQAVVVRVLDLAQATVATWNAGFTLGAIVSARALLETIAIFHSFLERAKALAAAKDWDALES
jgi:hypothetical protein